MSPSRYRVVQWATGNIGLRALREVIRHPSLELVGVLVYDPAKDGVDAGVLCGEDPSGIAATTDRGAIHALGADCALYMPSALELDDVVALLEAGTNVVTTRGELFARGERLGEGRRAAIERACSRGSSSIYATGSSPGFITDALPLALLSLQRRVEAIEIDEFANLSRRDSPNLLFELMGFGRPLESFDPNRSSFLLGEFGPALGILAEAAGCAVDEWICTGEVAAARRTTSIVAGQISAGSVAAQRTRIIGRSGGTDRIRFTPTWYCTTEIEPAWELRPTGWRVQVKGDAPLDVELAFPIPLDEIGSFTPAYTANRPVNAIPYVCAAPPGILSTTDLPPVTPAGPAIGG
ncbi:MAG TPA: dihydrodipicolinate reductase [Acidimicrobiia bacterium]|nr:dihydrodipicolinate reductase [Acidimicrobiia bacterium]